MITSVKRLGHYLGSLALMTSFLTGCETIGQSLGKVRNPVVSGDPCGHADWFEVGRVDGLSGVGHEQSMYVGRCLSRGLTIDNELYQAGWQKGLLEYCTPERGFDAGRSGFEYSGVCPSHMESAFLKRFKVGRQIAALERKNAEIESLIDERLAKLSAPGLISGQTSGQASMPGSQSSPTSSPTSSILTEALTRQAKSEQESQIEKELQNLRDLRARNDLSIRELESK